ncbi:MULTISPECIES: glycine cleavage T C-terminal barrel domain-containing protein [unclassified Mesorhizobium]|uniref:glycine cleavage T C-terminal barrel domain-containing protein n=1 Tax=unclassified Mesorhizobium TaxID=325217 RepID=UPI001FF024A7|nr:MULTISPECIES: glycine cleavage T C-terminal barrel domain-containing protein [unclassified Mesorhizobium]
MLLTDREGGLQVAQPRSCHRADAGGFEPVWRDGRRVGFVTSGGFGYTIGRSVALALVDADFTEEGTALSVHIVGVERPARVVEPALYDPSGKAMRQ